MLGTDFDVVSYACRSRMRPRSIRERTVSIILAMLLISLHRGTNIIIVVNQMKSPHQAFDVVNGMYIQSYHILSSMPFSCSLLTRSVLLIRMMSARATCLQCDLRISNSSPLFTKSNGCMDVNYKRVTMSSSL